MKKLAIVALAACLTVGADLAWRSGALGGADGPSVARWTVEEAAGLDQRIEELEERLLAHQARVSFWQEMRARHADVSAVACANLGDHAMAMRQSESRHQVRLVEQQRRRVASAAVTQ